MTNRTPLIFSLDMADLSGHAADWFGSPGPDLRPV